MCGLKRRKKKKTKTLMWSLRSLLLLLFGGFLIASAVAPTGEKRRKIDFRQKQQRVSLECD